MLEKDKIRQLFVLNLKQVIEWQEELKLLEQDESRYMPLSWSVGMFLSLKKQVDAMYYTLSGMIQDLDGYGMDSKEK